ncbi:MAG: AAA domain-containing protein [Chthoniobacteraceae bacterium]
MPVINDRYALLAQPPAKLGRFAEVSKATDLENGQIVAVKRFRSRLPDDPVTRERFECESRALRDKLRHPRIISLLDFGLDAATQQPFLILEWGGEDLSVWLRERKPFSDWNTFYDEIGQELLEAVAHAHAQEVVHRELKPADFLRGENGEIRLADFGVSKFPEFIETNLDINEVLKANAPFSPPDGYEPLHPTATDVYGFAAVALSFLAPKPLKTREDILLAVQGVRAPREVQEILQDALSALAAERPEDAQLLLARLERVRQQEQRTSVQRRTCPLVLTANARTRLRQACEGVETEQQAASLIEADLEEASALQFADDTDPQTGVSQRKEDEFWIFGSTLRLRVGIDRRDPSHLAIISASRPDSPTSLERQRETGWVPPFRFRYGRPPSGTQGRAVMDELRRGMETFADAAASRQAAQDEEKLFRTWQDMLRLREDHAREGRKHRYSGYSVDGLRVVFQIDGDVDPSIKTEVWTVTDSRVRGTVEDVEGNSLTLFVEEDCGDLNRLRDEGEITIDARSTQRQLRWQRQALDAVRAAATARLSALKAALIHPSDSRSRTPPAISSWFFSGLDEDKKDAVVRALAAEDFFLVEGPPGTGKTTFIAELILQFLDQCPDKRVLLTSQTHIAVDNAIERIVELRPDLRVIRVGFQEAKVAPAVQRFLLTRRVEEWRERVRKQAREFIRVWAKQQGIDIHDVELGLAIEQLIRLRQRQEQAGKDEKELQDSLSRLEARIEAPGAEEGVPTTAEQAGAAEAEHEKLAEEAIAAAERRKRVGHESREAEKELEKRFPKEYAELQVKEESLEALEEWQEAFIGTSPQSRQFRKLLDLSNEWVQRFGNTEDDDVRDAVLMDSQVASGTCIGIAGADAGEREEYGLCILDEASKASFTEALVPLSRSARWVLVGDPLQLPPFVDAALSDREGLEKHDIDPDLIRETLLSRVDRLQLPQVCRAMLTSQHRMIAPIGDLISETFYEGHLRSIRRDAFSPPAGDWVKPVMWLNTSHLANRREMDGGGFGGSFVNPLEAQVIRKLIGRIEFHTKGRHKSSAPVRRTKIIVLTGYAGQRRRIESLLAQDRAQWQFIEAECHTVDAYQGREADVVIFSVTRSNAQGRPGFLKETARINVALSRGRDGLCMVGDAGFCRDLGVASPLGLVLDYMKTHADSCRIEDVQP